MSISGLENMNHPLLQILRDVEEKSLSGVFKVMRDSEQAGMVLMYEGFVAWATSRNQTENLGSFLEKVGMIPKEKQKEILEKLKSSGKTRGLDVFLEEPGLTSSSVLRECLKGHLRAAVASLISIRDVTIISGECELAVKPELLFRLSEVLPETTNADAFTTADSFSSGTVSADSGAGSEENENILKNLSTLSGYRYSFIYHLETEVLASHKSDTFPRSIDEAVSSSAAWVRSSAEALKNLDMGNMEFVLLEHDRGSLIVQWPDEKKDLFIAASFDKNGKPGVIKHKISELIPAIRHISAEKS